METFTTPFRFVYRWLYNRLFRLFRLWLYNKWFIIIGNTQASYRVFVKTLSTAFWLFYRWVYFRFWLYNRWLIIVWYAQASNWVFMETFTTPFRFRSW
jgi:hypothetical protein